MAVAAKAWSVRADELRRVCPLFDFPLSRLAGELPPDGPSACGRIEFLLLPRKLMVCAHAWAACGERPASDGFRITLFTHTIIMFVFRSVLIVVLATLCLPFSSAEARRPHGTDINGVITQVDQATHALVFTDEGGAQRRFVLSDRAKVWHDGQEVSPATLRPGMRAQVVLHQPLIGPDFVTVVRLLGAAVGGK